MKKQMLETVVAPKDVLKESLKSIKGGNAYSGCTKSKKSTCQSGSTSPQLNAFSSF